MEWQRKRLIKVGKSPKKSRTPDLTIAPQKALSETQQHLDRLCFTPDKPLVPEVGDAHETARPTSSAPYALDPARQEYERLVHQQEQVRQRIREIGRAYHFVDLERGVRRNGQLIAADIDEQIAHLRAIAQTEGLSPSSLDRIEKAQASALRAT